MTLDTTGQTRLGLAETLESQGLLLDRIEKRLPQRLWHVTALGFKMPLTKKGKKIKRNMSKTYGKKKGTRVFYASINKGKVEGAERKKRRT